MERVQDDPPHTEEEKKTSGPKIDVGDQEESKEELEESKGQKQVGGNPVEEEKEELTYPLQVVYCASK